MSAWSVSGVLARTTRLLATIMSVRYSLGLLFILIVELARAYWVFGTLI